MRMRPMTCSLRSSSPFHYRALHNHPLCMCVLTLHCDLVRKEVVICIIFTSNQENIHLPLNKSSTLEIQHKAEPKILFVQTPFACLSLACRICSRPCRDPWRPHGVYWLVSSSSCSILCGNTYETIFNGSISPLWIIPRSFSQYKWTGACPFPMSRIPRSIRDPMLKWFVCEIC